MAPALMRMPSLVAETREERLHDLGIECPSAVEWKNWRLGGEYRKGLTLLNASQRHQRIKYSLPTTGAFSMDYPEELKLSPGMSATLAITFRPKKGAPLTDKIVFHTAKGAFSVRLEGKQPSAEVALPSSVDFGFCPVKEVTCQPFVIRNNGHVRLSFSWEYAAPFSISPGTGTMQPGQATECIAAFKPEEASSFNARAICRSSAGMTSEMTLSGVSKYPFLAVSRNAVDFGEVLSGSTAVDEIILTNAALVEAPFEVVRVNGDERSIRISPSKGKLQPNDRVALKVTYSPLSAGTSTSEVFEIPTATGRPIRIEGSGSAIAPRVSISTALINFGMVRAGSEAVKSFRLENHSGINVEYRFQGVEAGPFSVPAKVGTCPPFGAATISVRFVPKDPLMFHKPLFLLFRNGAPLKINLVGSAFNDKMRPPLISTKQFSESKNRLEQMMRSGEDALDSSQMDDASQSDGADCWEAHFSEEEESKKRARISADVTCLDFGACSRAKPSEYKAVTLTNHSEERVTVNWMTPEESGYDNEKEAVRLYQIFPQEAEIRPGGSFIFNVVFRPKRENACYCDSLEALVVPKRLREWSGSLEDVAPPAVFRLKAVAHTFKSDDSLMPKAEFSSTAVTFPPTHVGDPSYQTSAIYNRGDTPLKFEIRPTSLNSPFKAHPSEGVIQGRQFQVICYRFYSEAEGPVSESVLCCLNKARENATEIRLSACAYWPRLELTENANLKFLPTCIGSVSERSYTLRNLVKIPVKYSWAIPESLTAVMSVTPKSGLLKGSESKELVWTFAPKESGQVRGKAHCFATGVRKVSATDSEHTSATQKLTLSVLGEGISGALRIEPEQLNLGTLLVGTRHREKLTLHNISDGQLPYALSIVALAESHVSEAEELTFDAPKGTIPARSFVPVQLSVRPIRRAELSYEIACQEREGDVTEAATCLVSGRADYPSLMIADIRCDGVSKDQLWRQLRISELNEYLSEEPGEFEKWQISGKESADWEALERGLVPLELDLGATLLGGKKMRVHLEIRNTGSLTSQWSLRLWGEDDVSLERWVEKRKPRNSEDRHRAAVLDENLFEVRPRSGTLGPMESCHVSVEYMPRQHGVHRLPAVLEISKGRRALLTLTGRTLESQEKHLIVPKNPLELTRVTLGDTRPPIQSTALRNGGACEIYYRLDTEPLTQLTKDNYGFEVLKVLNPEGCIPVGESVLLNWRFQPIEDRLYEVELPLHVQGGISYALKLRGRGTSEESVEQVDLGLGYNPAQTLFVSEQPLTLFLERVSFGHVPELSVNRRLVTVKNTSNRTVTFAWRAQDLVCGEVKVEPSQGTITPNSECVCKVVLTAGTAPQIFEATMICDVTQQPVSETSMSPKSPGKKRTLKASSGKENGRLSARDPNKEEVLIDTVMKIAKSNRGRGPVIHQSVSEATTESSRTRLGVAKKPSPMATTEDSEGDPAGCCLFLTVAGEVHSSDRYRALFGDLESRIFVQQGSGSQSPGASELQAGDWAVIGEVLGDILREAFQEPEVRHACEAEPTVEPSYSSNVPSWASMRHAPKASTARLEDEESDVGKSNQSSKVCVTDRVEEAFAGKKGQSREDSAGLGPRMAKDSYDGVSNETESSGVALGTIGTVGRRDDDKSEFKGLAEFVLEGTLFSVVKDAIKEQRATIT